MLVLICSSSIFTESPVTDIKNEFIELFIGTWDLEETYSIEGEKYPFSWGEGESLRHISLLFDYGLFDHSFDELILYTGNTFIVKEIKKISEGSFKIIVLGTFSEEEQISELILHSLDRKIIWFESSHEYELRTGETISNINNIPDDISNTIGTGIEFKYYRRSGPRFGSLNDYQVRIRKEPNLNGEHVGFLNKGQIIYILDETEERMKIGNMDSIWYKIKTLDGLEGWAYGYFIDLVTTNNHSESK